MIDPPPAEIIYCYKHFQKDFESIEELGVIFHEGMYSLQDMPDDGKHRLMVIDDMMCEALAQDNKSSNPSITDLFTRLSHHMNISVILVLHNLFNKAKQTRTVSLNSKYIILLKNPRDATIAMNLAKQVFPHCTGYLLEAYEAEMNKPYGHLLIDLCPSTSDNARLRGNIFGENGPMVLYQKNC